MEIVDIIAKLRQHYPEAILDTTTFLDLTTIELRKEDLVNVLSHLKQTGFEVLMDLSAVDYLEPTARTKVFYLLHNPTTFQRLRIILFVERDGTIPSVTSLWEGADWYERELYDLFGIHFSGHPDLKRILMPDNWIGHPLRRDYALTEESVEFKNNVKPKVPSEIIPYVKSKRAGI